MAARRSALAVRAEQTLIQSRNCFTVGGVTSSGDLWAHLTVYQVSSARRTRSSENPRSRHSLTSFPILTARIDDSGPASAFVFGNPDDPRLEHIQAHPASRLRQKFALSKAARAIWRRFVAGKDPLSRFFVISAAEDEHYIGIVLNHFIGDAGSVSMLARELVAFYRSATSGTAPRAGCPIRTTAPSTASRSGPRWARAAAPRRSASA